MQFNISDFSTSDLFFTGNRICFYVMSSYFDEHDCAPLAEGAAPDELLQFARWEERGDTENGGDGKGKGKRRWKLEKGGRYGG